MNHWCESCARKNLCYVVDDRPKCFVPITNTARGTPESYLAKTLRYSRDSHEIAKDEPQTDIHDLTDCDFCKDRNCKDCEGGKDEPQTERSRR